MADRSRWVVAAAAAAVLALVGAVALVATLNAGGPGEDDVGSGGAPGDSGAAGGSARPSPEPSAVAPRDQQPRPDLPLTLSIQSYELLAPDRLQIRYAIGVPECYGTLDRSVVRETERHVVVTLLRGPLPAPTGRPCPEIALIKDTVVELDAPLGDRRVLDGPARRPVRRGHDTA